MRETYRARRQPLPRAWLQHHTGQPICLCLANGQRLDGVLLAYDQVWLRIQPNAGGSALLIRQATIAVAERGGTVAGEDGDGVASVNECAEYSPGTASGDSPRQLERVAPTPLPLEGLAWVRRTFPYRIDLTTYRSAALLFVATLVVYLVSNNGNEQPYNQFVLLSDALLHGRLDLLNPPSWLELARWQDKFYVVYPPLPALLLMPFVAVFGPSFPQTALTIPLGALNVALCYLTVWQLFKNRAVARWTALLFAFGTIHWYSAENGSVWATEHIVALFFLWLALLETATRRRFVLIGIFIGGAYLARLPTILAALFVMLYCWERFVPQRLASGEIAWSQALRAWLRFSGGIVCAVLLNAWYNWVRFGRIDNIGYTLLEGFDQMWWFRYGLLDVRYIPGHLREMLLRPPVFRAEWPFIVPDIYAMALWVTTPAFVLIAWARWQSRIVIASAATTLAIAAPILMHGASGFAQFGYRYTLDFTPFLVLLTASALSRGVTWWMKGLIVASVLANLWGVLMLSFFDMSAIG